MTTDELVCVLCPNGCVINVTCSDEKTITKIKGNRCPRGMSWARQEIESPVRTFSSNVIVEDGDFITVSVKITKPVPLVKVFDVMEEIKKIRVKAPVSIGQVLLVSPAGMDTEVVATRNVAVKQIRQ